MDQATLVGPDLKAGLDAVAMLDAASLEPIVALMAVFPEYDDWRFVISSPSLDQTQLIKAHETVARVFGGTFAHTLPTLMIFPIKDPFIRELHRIFGKAKSVNGMRLGGQKIGNRFVSASYVYRIR